MTAARDAAEASRPPPPGAPSSQPEHVAATGDTVGRRRLLPPGTLTFLFTDIEGSTR
jgi:class 3 adenylate cyclase